MSDEEPVGRLVITWSPPCYHGLLPWQCVLTDADTGEQITTVTKLVIVADPGIRQPITAELTMLCDQDGQLLRTGKPVPDGEGGYLTSTFRWWIVEMRCDQDCRQLRPADAEPEPVGTELVEMARTDIRPGDVFILHVPGDLSEDAAARLRASFAEGFPGGAKASLIRREHVADLDERTAAALDAGA